MLKPVVTKSVSSTPTLQFKNSEGTTGQNSGEIKVGEIISYIAGKFNDPNKNDTAYVIKTKQGVGNPVEDGTPDEYSIQFTDTKKEVNIGCCDARLINEGDMNCDGKEELSVFQYPENGNTCYFKTYTSAKGEWEEFIEPFMVPVAGEPVSDSKLQAMVFLNGKVVYYYNTIDSDENIVAVKAKAIKK